MLKISILNSSEPTTLKLEGKLLLAWLPDFHLAHRQLSQRGQRVRLDLENLTFADSAGEHALRQLAGDPNVELIGCSSFIRELLRTEDAMTITKPVGGDHASEEAELVERIRRNDSRACEALVREHGPRMLVVAARFFKSSDDRDDAVQDAFISAFRSIDSFGGASSLATWLHRIVVNACLMKLRRKRNEVSIETLLPQFAADGHHAAPIRSWDESDGYTRASESETRQVVRSCIDQLPQPYREVLVLRDIEELDTQQTAELLDCTVANVKTRLHRARQALRTLLEQTSLIPQ